MLFGTVANRAVELLKAGICEDPSAAWKYAACEIVSRPLMQKKSCPRAVFVGLCNEGLVIGVKDAPYKKKTHNLLYALEGIQVLKHRPELISSSSRLWKAVIANIGVKTVHNQQMHVLIGLIQCGNIKVEK